MLLVNVGASNLVVAERIVSVVSYDSAPIKRIAQDAKAAGRLIDTTYGRKTQSVIITDSDHCILSALPPETILTRMGGTLIRDAETAARDAETAAELS